jgi:pilus assembly protein Flp/PilA
MLGRFVRSAVAFLKDESGPTAVEYAVMLALILLACLVAIANIGTETCLMFNNVDLQGVKVKA